jgi:hypothetical protein
VETPKDTELKSGSITGQVIDEASDEGVATTEVLLTPGGGSKVTNSDGIFEFPDVDAGTYTLSISRKEYVAAKKEVTVTAGKPQQVSFILTRLPAKPTVQPSSIDFGDNKSNTTLQFNVLNEFRDDLIFSITNDCKWIKTVSPLEGTLKWSKTQSIVVTIDRDKLEGVENEYNLVVSSSNGGTSVKITATGIVTNRPAVVTQPVSNITATTATFNGRITNPGSPAYTERGFVYSITPNPTLADRLRQLVYDQSSTSADFYVPVSGGLEFNKTYYVRAYVISPTDTVYGVDEMFSISPSKPTVTSQAATSITGSGATFNGTIVNMGIPVYTERGFVYANSRGATLSDNIEKITVSGIAEVGKFSTTVSGLSSNVTYYVRAYATNEEGIAYGDDMEFKTLAGAPSVSTQDATSVDKTSATINGTIISVGNPAYTERGFCYSKTNVMPAIIDIIAPSSGTGVTGSFSADLTQLEENTTYYVRAYARTNDGDPAYGTVKTFKTAQSAMITVSTQDATSVDKTSATVNGTIISAGDPAYTERGFCYSKTNAMPAITDIIAPNSGAGVTGAFSADLTQLEENTTYYVRAYARTNEGDPAYGTVKTFKTAQGATVTVTDWLAISNGIEVEVSFSSNAATYYASIYTQSNIPSTDAAIIANLKATGDMYPAQEGAWNYWPDEEITTINAQTSYTYCAFAEDAQGNSGQLVKKVIATPTASGPKATITIKSITSNSMTFDIQKSANCSYYICLLEPLDDSNDTKLSDIFWASNCYYWEKNDPTNYRDYDNYTNLQIDLEPNTTYAFYSFGFYRDGLPSGVIDKHFVSTQSGNELASSISSPSLMKSFGTETSNLKKKAASRAGKSVTKQK